MGKLEHICYNCLKNKDAITTLSINNRGYGSAFDGDNTEIALCEECITLLDVNEDWFDNSIVEKSDGDYVSYTDEILIIETIKQLPVEGQERVLNKPNIFCDDTMNTEEWIKLHKNGFFMI